MRIAILGCGYVADFYMATLADYPEFSLAGAFDVSAERLRAFSTFNKTKAYESFESFLADPTVELVLNLTNPRAHFDTTKACLEAGKHVYSEKPLAMDSSAGAELVRLAEQRSLRLAVAPCSVLGETAQTLWKALRDDAVGPVRMVYASFDDGMVHRMSPTRWTSQSGALWPAKDEFEVGCTYEHAGYVLSWLAAFFGPARRVNAYASVRLPDKGVVVDGMAPDFTVGCIEYDGGIVARVTCSIVAPVDKSVTIVGERGYIHTKYVRNDGSPVYIARTPPNRYAAAITSRLGHLRVKMEQWLHLPFSVSGLKIERKLPYARKPRFRLSAGNKPVDFMRGPAELAAAYRESRPCRLSPGLALHMVELIETLQHPERFEMPRTLKSTFEPMEPLPWDR